MEEKAVLSKLLRRVRLHKVTREDEVKPVIEIITRYTTLCAQIYLSFLCAVRGYRAVSNSFFLRPDRPVLARVERR